MPEKPHPAELVANLARLGEVRQLLAAIEAGDLDRLDRVECVLRARARMYEALTEPSQQATPNDDLQGRLL
jgi:hypothetical protein